MFVAHNACLLRGADMPTCMARRFPFAMVKEASRISVALARRAIVMRYAFLLVVKFLH